MFNDCTTKVDSEPLNGSNKDTTNPYEMHTNSYDSAVTLNLIARLWAQHILPRIISSGLVPQPPSPTPNVPPTKNDWDSLLRPISIESSSRIVIPTNVHSVNQPQEHIEKWTQEIHPHEQDYGDPPYPDNPTATPTQTEACSATRMNSSLPIEHKVIKILLIESVGLDDHEELQ
ncbi:hypothetical protein Tco_1112358 [Tanacetum coccineum]|uniref:Uncharacterized protein n=1 Tax=Tanacetum coccineum TaxID=301880 RepID=A0ABQ5IQL2_9ASTR